METSTIVLVAALSLLSFLCVLSNLIVCLAICFKKTIRSLAKFFIFSLALTDLLVGGVSIPFYAWLETKWRLMSEAEFEYYAIIYDSIDAPLHFSSIVHLCIMSIDRAIATTKPLYHRRFMSRRKVLKLLLVPWLLGATFVVTYIVAERTDFLYFIYFIALTVLFYFVPIIIIAISYTFIFREVKRRNNSNLCASKLNEMKLTRTLSAIILVFVICWTPFVCLSGYILVTAYVSGSRPSVHWYYVVIKLISYVNSALNPFIYAIFQSQFRKAFKEMFESCKKHIRNPLEVQEDMVYEEEKV